MANLRKLLKKRERLEEVLEQFAFEIEECEGSYSEHLVADEYDNTKDKLTKVIRKIDGLCIFDEQVEEWRHDSEELEAVHRCLDDHNVPRAEDDKELSTWGRVLCMLESTKRS